MRCKGTTKSGAQCKNQALEESEFCRTHQDQTEALAEDNSQESADQAVPEPELHPAIQAYVVWEDSVEFPQGFKEIKNFIGDHGDQMIVYRTPDGGRRVISEDLYEKRKRSGKFGYFLLSHEREREGVELISEIPNAPSSETLCPVCKTPRFAHQNYLYAFFRDEVEKVFRTKDEETEETLLNLSRNWGQNRWTHSQCAYFRAEWLSAWRKSKRQCESNEQRKGSSPEVVQKILEDLKDDYRRKAEGVLHVLSTKRGARKEQLEALRRIVTKEVGSGEVR